MNARELGSCHFFQDFPYHHLFETTDVSELLAFQIWFAMKVIRKLPREKFEYANLIAGSKAGAALNKKKNIVFHNLKITAPVKILIDASSGSLENYISTLAAKFGKEFEFPPPAGWDQEVTDSDLETVYAYDPSMLEEPHVSCQPIPGEPNTNDTGGIPQLDNQSDAVEKNPSHYISEQAHNDLLELSRKIQLEKEKYEHKYELVKEQLRALQDEHAAPIQEYGGTYMEIVSDLMNTPMELPIHMRHVPPRQVANTLLENGFGAFYDRGAPLADRIALIKREWTNIVVDSIVEDPTYTCSEFTMKIKDPKTMFKEVLDITLSRFGITGAISSKLDQAISFIHKANIQQASTSTSPDTLKESVDPTKLELAKLSLAKTESSLPQRPLSAKEKESLLLQRMGLNSK